jgi:hypothetical protein
VSAAVIAAVSCVALTRVVSRGEPFQLTTSPFAKPVPFTVSVIPAALQYGVLFEPVVDAESDVMVGKTIGNETELDVLALDTGVATATWAVPTAAMSAAGTGALSCAALVCVAPKNVLASGVVVPAPFVHCTTEHGSKFVPVTINVAPAAPAVAVEGEIEAIVGAGGDEAATEKGDAFERTPLLDTSMLTFPGDAINEAGTTAVSCVELTKVVVSAAGSAGGGFTAHSTTEPFTKFVPVTVRVTAEALHDGVEFDEVVDAETPEMMGGEIVNGIC